MLQKLVIVVGVYPEIVRHLGGALVEAGFTVRPTTSCVEAEAALGEAGAAALVTSPFLPAAQRKRIAKAARAAGAKVVMLHHGELADTEMADAVVSALPESVVEALRNLFSSAQRHSA